MTGNLNLLINFVWKFMGTVRFRNDNVATILGFGDLWWGNILITRVYFVEGLGHNLFSVGQFCDSDLEVVFRRNACFVKNLEGVDLLKGDHSTNLYTINLYEMAYASPICLMARASSTKSWLWHQRLSHLNFDNINDLARNDLVSGLPKFKYHKEHLCPSCEQGKSKRASHPPKPVPNSRQRLHLLNMDLYGPMRIASINGKRVYNRRTKKIIETMNVLFDELSAMAFEQRSSKPMLQSMTFRQISSGLDHTYAPSTITTQQPSEGELDLLFEAMYDDYIGGQPSATARTVSASQKPQVRQTSTASTSIADTAPTPTNSSSHATKIPNVNEAMTNHAWIDSMQEELLQFKRLDAKPTEKHLKEVKRIFLYLRGTINTGLWYSKDSCFELTGFSDADYAGSIAISCNLVQHSRTKHIAVRYHFIKEHVEKGTIELYFVKTDYQLADLFTKALPADHFNYLVRRLGMRSLSP
nr:retrovirus-related Pol polyprotein from transposon TNT 1-94 [Tanacetum cinerariifolium]